MDMALISDFLALEEEAGSNTSRNSSGRNLLEYKTQAERPEKRKKKQTRAVPKRDRRRKREEASDEIEVVAPAKKQKKL